jgi:hypothetical protein
MEAKRIETAENQEPTNEEDREATEPKKVEEDTGKEKQDRRDEFAAPKQQKVKARKVRRQFNLSGCKIAIGLEDGEQGAIKETPFEDPTEPLPPMILPDIEFAEGEEIWTELNEKRILLLSSFEVEPSRAVAYSIANSKTLAGFEKRTLILGGRSNRSREDLDIEFFKQPEDLSRNRQIIVIDIDRKGVFLESLRTIQGIHAGTIKASLRAREIFVVCTICQQLLEVAPEEFLPEPFDFYHRPVPFLSYVLRKNFSPERASELEALLLAQKSRGLWGNSADFYQQVSGYLRRGAESLEEIVERKETLSYGLTVRQALDQIQSVKPADLLRDGEEVKSTVLYTAAYFPDLTPQDFEKVLLLLLGERTATLEEETQVLNDRNEVQTQKKRVVKRLLDLWREAPDRLLESCCLATVPLSSGTHVMDFSQPYLRKELRLYFENRSPILLVRMFDRLQGVGLLFATEVSSTILENLVRLFVERTLSDPAYCGKEWLVSLVVGLSTQVNAKPVSGDPSDQLLQLIEQLESDWLRRLVLGRLAQLIREMLQHRSLQNTVHGFLEALLTGRQHDAALDIVLELATRLRFSPQFDPFSWFRRLLDQSQVEVRERVYSCLLQLAVGNGSRILDVFTTLSGWLPEVGREEDRYSLSNRCALSFIFAYCWRIGPSLPPKHYGEWPSRYALFAAFPEDPEAIRASTELLVAWLFHPGMRAIFEVADHALHLAYAADLIESWLSILEGLKPAAIPPEGRRVADALIAAVGRRVDRNQKRALVERWRARQQEYVEDVCELPQAERERRSELMAKRGKLIDLVSRITDLGPAKPKPRRGSQPT